ncbi:MAG: 2-oxo-4-hydroxy-4-carboxy-5-ureidoimidazoline decarboxylase [Gammaproteobacteria bacterium]|nr:2-oxo-4-hydroxy-4-carboxy-5-ureidoimidazoline decarboxylase [Gammaproteobacteria bacterium]
MTRAEFVARYGGIYEHSPWVAEQVYDSALSGEDEALPRLFAQCVDDADDEVKLALICAHPDLAGKAAVSGELTEDSSEEQHSAGIDQCTPEEYRRFQSLNEQYKAKFHFPFVMAVRNSNRHRILAAFEERLQNGRDEEAAKAIGEIHKIARLRFAAMATEKGKDANHE